jgi:hypothetical protein
MIKQLVVFLFFIGVFLIPRSIRAQDSLTLLAELWGEGDEDYFVMCSPAGDINADGFADIAVGTLSRGYLKIFLGSEEFDTIPDVRIVRKGASPYEDYFLSFFSIACAGDVNGDGYDDVIMGDPFGPFSMGEAYIFYGGDPMDTTADVILLDGSFNYKFGYSVSSAGDVNGDGYDDVIVGAPDDDYDGRGRAFIYFGGENMDNIFDIYIEGTPLKAEEVGKSVAGIGDVNGDSYDDVLIGSPKAGSPWGTGKASVYFGGDPMDTTADITLNGDSIEFVNFGRVVASAGDVNGDGAFDILVGGKGGYPKCARLFLTKDSGGVLELDTFALFGEEMMPSSFGFRLSSAGDLNHDGYDDIIIGDYQAGTEFKGKAYVYMVEVQWTQ